MESTRKNLPDRLRHFSEIGKDLPKVLIMAPLHEAAEEIEVLRHLLSAYVADEDRFNAGNGEPYGSITTDVGIRARSALSR